VVTVTAPGRAPRRYEIKLAAKEQQTLTVEPGLAAEATRTAAGPAPTTPVTASAPLASAPAAELSTHAAAPARGGGPVLGYALLGGGVIALGAAGFFGMQALSARNDAEKACFGQPPLCRMDGKAALDRDRSNSLRADIAAGAGLLLAGAGLWVLFHRSEAEVAARVAPAPGGAALQLAGRF
jgi:hypothetical protein